MIERIAPNFAPCTRLRLKNGRDPAPRRCDRIDPGAIDSIQCSWVKLGMDGAAAMLMAGCNDLGGVLMDESISRAAGAAHGQMATAVDLQTAAESVGRNLRQRTTLYKDIRSLNEMA